MPYKLRKAPKRDLYWVIGPDGKHHSKDPLPKARAEAQMKALYAAERREDEARIPNAREEKQIEKKMEGGGPLPQLSILQQIAKAAYSTSPPQQIGPFRLRSSTPTLKFYVLPDEDQRFTDTIVVGIRGTNTSDKQDLWADTQLALGKLEQTPRWTKDLADFKSFMSRIRDPDSVDIYGVGHSLGGAVLDMFLKKGLIQQGVSYNPAISLGDAQKDIPNRRIYQDGDPLLAIMGRSARNVEVRPKKVKEQSVGRRIANVASYFIPYVGLVTKGMDTLDAHALDNFTGGTHLKNVLKKLGLKDEGHSLAELAKASRIPRKTLQEVYNRGIGAYTTNPSSVRMKGTYKKGVNAPMSQKLSKEQWAMARVYSFIDGNPKHDTDLRGGAGTIAMVDEFMRIVADDVARLPPTARHKIESLVSSIKTKLTNQRHQGLQNKKLGDVLFFVAQVSDVIINQQSKITDDRRPAEIDKYIQNLFTTRILPFVQNIDPDVDMGYGRESTHIHARINVQVFQDNTLLAETRDGSVVRIVGEAPAPAPEPEPEPEPAPAPAPAERRAERRAEFPPMRPRGRGKKVCMPKKEYLAEHEQLTDVLARPTPAKLRKELAKQTAEVKMRGSGKDDFDFPAIKVGKKTVEMRGPQVVAMLNKKRREKAEAERRARTTAPVTHTLPQHAGDDVELDPTEFSGSGRTTYLRQARAKAKAYGLDPKKLVFATDGKHKFSYDGVLFGREGYGDSLSYAKLEKEGKVPKGTTEMKKRVFHNSHEKIKGNWRANKISPNNLALNILW